MRIKVLAACILAISGCSDYNLHKVVQLAPEIEVTPLEHDYGALNAENDSGEITVTISNVGNKELEIDQIYLVNGDPTFEILSPYPSRLDPNETAEIIVSYDPVTYEENENYLAIISNDSDESEIYIPLNGSGDAPVIYVKPDYFDFGLTYIGCEDQLEIIISNVGNVDLEVSDIDYYVTTPQDLYSDPESVDNGPLPWILAPGEEKYVYVDYLPEDMVDDDAYARIKSNDPLNPEVDAVQIGYGDYEGIVADIHEQGDVTPVDILFVIDNSGSMSNEQTELANNFDTFINVFSSSGVDYQIAFITTDSPEFVGDIITPLTPDPVLEATTQIGSIGYWGSPWEKGFDMSYEATTTGGDAAPGSTFLRDSARLVVIYISDEDDFSSIIPLGNDMASHIEGLKSDPSLAVIHAVAGDVPGGCGNAQPAIEYNNAVVASGGTFLSICSTDWGTPMEELARDSVGLVQFDLSEQPIEDTIWVTVDGVVSTDWVYNPLEQAIIFTVPPSQGSEIIINYALFPECD